MKKVTIIMLMSFLFYTAMMAQSTSNVRYLKPTNLIKKVTTVVSGKSRSYYSLHTVESSIINIQGPGKLRVLTRGRFIPNASGKISYEVVCAVDGGEQKIIEVTGVERSNKAIYLNETLGVPGQLRDFEIELGRGYHTIEFKLANENTHVACRYSFLATKAKKQEWVAFCPLRPSEPVDLISREETVNYYRFSKEKPLKIEINGPTELRVLTRIENHFQMKGRIHYRVQVKESDKVKSTYQLSSRRSEIAVYKDHTELIPGKACEFVINVPKGRHIFEILPLDEDKSTLLGRFLLPKKDVNLEQ